MSELTVIEVTTNKTVVEATPDTVVIVPVTGGDGFADHIVDAAGAHAASAIAFTPTGTVAATTVQAAIAEVAAEAGGGGGVTDHGALTGLTDDDHSLYALADGTRGTFAAVSHTHATMDGGTP